MSRPLALVLAPKVAFDPVTHGPRTTRSTTTTTPRGATPGGQLGRRTR